MATEFDVGRYLTNDETQASYISDCLEEGGIPLFLKAIVDVVAARGFGGSGSPSCSPDAQGSP